MQNEGAIIGRIYRSNKVGWDGKRGWWIAPIGEVIREAGQGKNESSAGSERMASEDSKNSGK